MVFRCRKILALKVEGRGVSININIDKVLERVRLQEEPFFGLRPVFLREILRSREIQMDSHLEFVPLPPLEGPPFPDYVTVKMRNTVTFRYKRKPIT